MKTGHKTKNQVASAHKADTNTDNLGVKPSSRGHSKRLVLKPVSKKSGTMQKVKNAFTNLNDLKAERNNHINQKISSTHKPPRPVSAHKWLLNKCYFKYNWDQQIIR